jgi:hypothetical protein
LYVCLLRILSNKLDLSQETRFTLPVVENSPQNPEVTGSSPVAAS